MFTRIHLHHIASVIWEASLWGARHRNLNRASLSGDDTQPFLKYFTVRNFPQVHKSPSAAPKGFWKPSPKRTAWISFFLTCISKVWTLVLQICSAWITLTSSKHVSDISWLIYFKVNLNMTSVLAIMSIKCCYFLFNAHFSETEKHPQH